MLIVMLTACSRHNDEFTSTPTPEQPKEPSVISIYVYQPDRPIVTRAGEGEVNPINNTTDESAINNIKIWVFNHSSEALIAYHSSETTTSNMSIVNENGVTYQLTVSPEFEAAAVKPNVDVFVLANDTQYDGDTTESTLEAAMIKVDEESDNYGLTTLTTEVPAGGLPMSGVLRDQSVTGTAPVYSLPTLKLVRAVSKVRFVFCREEGETPVKINSIQLGENMIPTQEYLFLGNDSKPYHIGTAYVAGATELVGNEDEVKTDIRQNANPLAYVYVDGMDPQEFEDKIAEGLNSDAANGITPKLSQVGPYYLRESDKQLSCTLKYQAGEAAEKTATVHMSATGVYEFSRNHTWTVYAYYGGSSLELITVIVRDWDDTNKNHNVYNW